MYMHQALPKEFTSVKNTSYQIKKKSSPKQKLATPRIHKQLSDQAIIKHCSSEKSNLHHIRSKQKPHLNSIDKNGNKLQAGLPKQIYSICHKKNQTVLKSEQGKQKQSLSVRQKNERNSLKKDIIVCRMENKVVKTVQCPFYYSDLSQIDNAYCHIYEGQSKNNGIRHGFGIQYFINGEKFIGIFSQNKANGQGTYYGLRKKVMGFWQEDKLKDVYLQL